MNSIELAATIENLDQSLDFVVDGIVSAGVDKKMAGKIRLACEEVFVNVIHYAYPEKQGNMLVSYDLSGDGKELLIRVEDKGIPFNPLEKEDPDVELPLEERQIGGLGIFMVRNIMDELSYAREEDTNILVMRKSMTK